MDGCDHAADLVCLCVALGDAVETGKAAEAECLFSAVDGFVDCDDDDDDDDEAGTGGGGIFGSRSMSIAFSSSTSASTVPAAVAPVSVLTCLSSASPNLLPPTDGPVARNSSAASLTNACLDAGIEANRFPPLLNLTGLGRFSGEGGFCGGNTQWGSLSV